MRMSLVVMLTMLYICGMMISQTCEQQTLMTSTQKTVVDELLSPPITDWSSPFQTLGSLITIPMHYILLFFKIGTFDFAIFYGNFVIIRYLFCAIGVGMVVGWITILRGVHSQ
jgi:hypothetical protein